MIKALFLDIDGILLGHKEGLNFPLPSSEIQNRLQNLAKRIPISLCTVKAYFAVKPIIDACGLQDSYHITDAGATIISGSTEEMTTTSIEQSPAVKLIDELRRANIYTEWYSGNEYFALSHENPLIREGRTKLLGQAATIASQATQIDISKIIALPLNEWQSTFLVDISAKFTNFAKLHWGINPSLIPKMAGFFTNPSATKRTGVQKVSEMTHIPLTDSFAAGDSSNDWTFMELCGHAGTLGNGTPELKELVHSLGNKGFITEKTVDEDGLLEVLEHFKL